MASTKVILSNVLIFLSSIVLVPLSHASALDGNESKELKVCGFDAIYNFGDSLSDTGNNAKVKMPRTVVALEYIVRSAGFPYIKAYLDANQTDFRNGVNFAFSGATTLSVEVLGPKLGAKASAVPITLNTQLKWLDEYLKGFCQKPEDCKEKLKSSLFIMGEIGANDYSLAIHFFNKTIEEVKKMGLVYDNVNTIEKAIEKVIDYGATRVLVPGIYQGGCTRGYVEKFASISTQDKFGCLKEYNDFFKYHNDLLQATFENLRKKYPGVSIVYGDYYHAMQFVLENLQKFGFEYVTRDCDHDNCTNPEKYIFKDFWHSNDYSNKYMVEWLIQDIIPKFGCK